MAAANADRFRPPARAKTVPGESLHGTRPARMGAFREGGARPATEGRKACVCFPMRIVLKVTEGEFQ